MKLSLLSALALASVALGCGGGGGGAAVAVPSCGAADTSEVCEVFRLVNEERIAAGRAPYTWNAELALAAQLHAADMDTNDYFSHTSQDGRSFSQRARDAGYDGSPRGENIAHGQKSASQVMGSWMGSGGHRNNILSESSTEIGVGLEGTYWVQVFGAR